MNDKIRDVINHWDPINLFPLSKYGEIIETIEGWIFKPFGG